MIRQIARNSAKQIFYIFNWMHFLLLQKRVSVVDLNVRFNRPGAVRLGEGSSINSGTFFDTKEGSVEIGDAVKIGDHCRFTTSAHSHRIHVGDNTSIHGSCHFVGEVEIGGGCLLARNILLSSTTHQFRSGGSTIKDQHRVESKKIVVEDDVWLGWGVVVLPGVTIAKGCVIGANAVVTKSTEPYGVYGGVPARLISRRETVSN